MSFNRITLGFTQRTYFVLLQEVDILKVELEASQRQLEGKDEAVRILQSMVGVFQKSLMVKERKQKKSSCQSSLKLPEPVFTRILKHWVCKCLTYLASTTFTSWNYCGYWRRFYCCSNSLFLPLRFFEDLFKLKEQGFLSSPLNYTFCQCLNFCCKAQIFSFDCSIRCLRGHYTLNVRSVFCPQIVILLFIITMDYVEISSCFSSLLA